MKRSGFHEVEPPLDAFDTGIQAVDAPVDAGHALLDMRHPHLQVLQIISDAVQAFFNPRQARLDLLQDRYDDVGDLGHVHPITVPGLFCKIGVGA